MERISENKYYTEIENHIWCKGKPAALLFVEPNNDECTEWVNALKARKPLKEDVEIPVYIIDIFECPNVAAEYNVIHNAVDQVKNTRPPMMAIYRNGYSNDRVDRSSGHEYAVSCINSYELAIISEHPKMVQEMSEQETLVKIMEWFNETYNTTFESISRNLFDMLMENCKYMMLGLCGCGNPDSTIEAIRDYLNAVNHHSVNTNSQKWKESEDMLEKSFGVRYVTANPLLQYMAYDLDDKGLTDHGSNIDGAWIEDKGRVCLYLFNKYLNDKEGSGNE